MTTSSRDTNHGLLNPAGQATPREELERQIMSSLVPKNEREHWAAREIGSLREQLVHRDAEIAELKADAMRYRWLCHRDATKDIAICEWVAEEGDWYALGMSKQPVDAIIDREIAKVRKP